MQQCSIRPELRTRHEGYGMHIIRGPKTVAYPSHKHFPRRPSRPFRSPFPVPMLVCATQARVSDENAAGSKPTYPSKSVPNPVLVPAYQIEPPSPLHMGIGERVWP